MKRIVVVKEGLVSRYRSKVRDGQLRRQRQGLRLSQKPFEDFSEDDLEIIVRDEEDKVKTSLKQSAVVAVLIALGLS